MRKVFAFNRLLLLLILVQMVAVPGFAQNPADPKLVLLLGRWEVVAYGELGVQVDKKQPALPQAIAVYRHIKPDRARQFYGYSQYGDYSRQESRDYQRWIERDSIQEVARLKEMIETPTFAVFFADSTLAVYNKDAVTNYITSTRSWQFALSSATMSLDIGFGYLAYERWQGQILLLTATRLTLFLPHSAEVVELVKTPFSLP